MKWLWNKLKGLLSSPLSRISFGLVMLTVSLVLISDFLGLMPDARGNEIAFRQHIAQSAALQVSMEIGQRSPGKIDQILQYTVERNDRVLSAAVKQLDGTLLHFAGAHESLWKLGKDEDSTVEQIRISLFTPKGEWGNLELALTDMSIGESMFRGGSSVLKIAAYVALAGFIGFFFFLKNVMRELDPDQVLPDRVRSALDSLADGLLILSQEGVIMFCNVAMAKRIGINATNLTGKDCNFLDWVADNEDEILPWTTTLESGDQLEDQSVELRVGRYQKYQFMMNSSPIFGEGDEVRGALLTFNDVTQLKKQHAELEVAVNELEESKVEIEKKNRELFNMATRDPLTNLFNRRAFFDAFDTLFENAQRNQSRLGCIMLDIDHFKSVNDTHGHGVGDVVIKYMADSLSEYLGDVDVVGRFGGEEFCLLMPDATLEETMARAEVIRKHIEVSKNADFPVPLKITSSFGVAVLPGEARSPSELVEHADMALYEAKTSSRNAVSAWQGDRTKEIIEENRIRAEAGDDRAAGAPDRRVDPYAEGGAVGDRADTATPSDAPNEASSAAASKTSAKVAGAAGIAAAAAGLAASAASGDATNATNTAPATSSAASSASKPTSAPATQEPITHSVKTAPGALVLVEQGKSLTQRQLLAANIETAIARARQDSLLMAVVVLDGTSLQEISNNIDFNIGIKLCSVLVDRLKNMLNLSDVVSQGDLESVSGTVTQTEQHEIAILLSDIASKENISVVVERLLSAFDQRIVINGIEYIVDTYAGISIHGSDGQDASSLLQNACMACSSAKSVGQRSAYKFYSLELDKAAKRSLRLQSDLYQSIEKNELEVYYQPKMDLATGDLLGFEALLRWKHGDMGMISPVEFIPLAEKSGLIHTINFWVITEVVDQMKRWTESGYKVGAVAVNVTALELKNAGFADSVLEILDETGLDPSSLEIEITESISIEELDVAKKNLDKLHSKGMAISVDDFGTGYSSLGYLQHFPVTRLKIDRIFVDGCTTDEKKAKVVRSIITMGNSLGMRVLAEGVETADQLLFLRDHHCDEMQGYYVSKPVNSTETTEYLEKPSDLSQKVLSATIGSQVKAGGMSTLSISGIDAIISKFPGDKSASANDDRSDDEHSGDDRKVQGG